MPSAISQASHGLHHKAIRFNGTSWEAATTQLATHFAVSVDTDNLLAYAQGETANVSGFYDDKGKILEAGRYYLLSSNGTLRNSVWGEPSISLKQTVIQALTSTSVYVCMISAGGGGGGPVNHDDTLTLNASGSSYQHINEFQKSTVFGYRIPDTGFTVLDVVYFNTTTQAWVKAQANNSDTLSDPPAVITEVSGGFATVSTYPREILVSNMLTGGRDYYLSGTLAGGLQSTIPITGYANVILKALSPSVIQLYPYPPYELELPSGPRLNYSSSTFMESLSNDGSIDSHIVVNLLGANFSSNVYAGYSVVFSGVPAGLTAHVVKQTDSEVWILLNGNASSHTFGDSIANLGVQFLDTAFAGVSASGVEGSTHVFSVDFRNPTPVEPFSFEIDTSLSPTKVLSFTIYCEGTFTVDWGDGVIADYEVDGQVTHTYTSDGIFVVQVTNDGLISITLNGGT